MLMITEQRNADALAFTLSGSLSGDWAIEFKRFWTEMTASFAGTRMVVDLTEVTFVDDIGKELLSLIVQQGAELIARDVLMKSVIQEISNETSFA